MWKNFKKDVTFDVGIEGQVGDHWKENKRQASKE
jgi:hypothetical protein